MLFRTLPKTLLEIFYEIIFNSKVMVKSTQDPYEEFEGNS